MRRDNNCGGIMEYVEHLAWVLFLKFLDEQESIFETEAELAGRKYRRIIEGEYRWSEWVPKALGRRNGVSRRASPEWDGETLMQFVRGELIPHLASLTGSPEREIIAGVFNDRNIIVCASPYNLKDVLDIIDRIDFKNLNDVHTVASVYEDLLKKLGSENKLAGEFYTPRPVIRFVVDVISPQIGEKVYDPACGSCGFLAEAYEHMRGQEKTTRDFRLLQQETFFGNEKKSVPALLGLMNLILHGVQTPRILRRNTLEERAADSQERFTVVLTNPPFGGTENAQIQQNFPVKSNATELLFLQHIMKKLKAQSGARCGMVVPEGTLFRGGAFAAVKQELLEEFNLFMVVSLPPGTFAPYSDVKTALLFFEKPGPTREVFYYEMALRDGLKKFSKGSQIADEDFEEARCLWNRWDAYRRGEGPRPELTARSWIEQAETLAERGYDLSAKNPARSEADRLQHPAEIIEEMLESNREMYERLKRLQETLSKGI
jgi:type I restriction enzyme M protein